MKRSITLLLLFLGSLYVIAQRDPIVIHNGGSIDDRSGTAIYPDMPDAFYEHDVKTNEIIIDGHGVVNYYDVEITSPVTNAVELTTQVDGTYDTFDISSLPAGSHVITIESPSGNIYEGTFTSY